MSINLSRRRRRHTNRVRSIPEHSSLDESVAPKKHVVVKVGMLGDSQIGKTSLMSKYADHCDHDCIEALGVNWMERTIRLRNVDVTISVWDFSGQREYTTLMPLVCADAKVLLFVFDLNRRQSLMSIKKWYKEALKENTCFLPFLIGTGFDAFDRAPAQHKHEVTRQARKFARKMRAPLMYCCSSPSGEFEKKMFKLIVAKVFNLKPRPARQGALDEQQLDVRCSGEEKRQTQRLRHVSVA